MFRTGSSGFPIGFWIFITTATLLFTNAEGKNYGCLGIENTLVRFTSEPHDVIASEGVSVRLPCGASRRVTVRWRHAISPEPTRHHEITADDNRKILDNGTLLISSMSPALAGYYQCSLTDHIGTLLSQVVRLSLPELPKFVAPPRSILSVVGSTTLLPCGLAPGANIAVIGVQRGFAGRGVTSMRPPVFVNVTWLYNSVPLPLEVGMSLLPSGSLELSECALRHSGAYSCRVAVGGDSATGEVVELRVISGEEAEAAPRFIVTPEATTALEGSTVTLECAAVGVPAPQITWLYKGEPVDLSSLESRLWVSAGGSLVVSGVRGTDYGAYTCRAAHSLQAHTLLNVLTIPRVTMSQPPSISAPWRSSLTLSCKVKPGSAAKLSWYKDGDQITPNQRDIAASSDGSLRILGVLAVDSGVWQCLVRGDAGGASRGTALTVQLTGNDDQKPSPLQKTQKSPLKKHTKKHKKFQSNENYDSIDFLTSLVSDSENATLNSDEDGPIFNDYDFYEDFNTDSLLHAAKGFDLDALRASNGSLGPIVKELRAVIVKHSFVTLSWEADGTNVTGYAIVYKVKGSERERVSLVEGNKHEVIVGNLQPNTTYELYALAYSGRQASTLSQPLEVTTTAEEEQTSPPSSITVTALNCSAFSVTWPPIPGLNYAVYYTLLPSGRTMTRWGGSEGTVVSGLTPGGTYSVCAGGSHTMCSAAVNVSLPAAVVPPPSHVNVNWSTKGDYLVVSWSRPAVSASELVAYKVRSRGAGRKPQVLTLPASVTSTELTHCTSAVEQCSVRVCSVSADGMSPCSEWIRVTAGPVVPGHPHVQPPPINSRAGRDWISLWWRGGPSSTVIDGVQIGWGLGVADDVTKLLPPTATSHVVKDLQPNSEYVISLRYQNGRGLGPPVYATVRTSDGPDDGPDDDGPDDWDEPDQDELDEELLPPIGVKAIMLSGTTAVVYWTDPTLPKGQNPLLDNRRYIVRVAGPNRVRNYNATDLNLMIDDLRPHTTYEFSVQSIQGSLASPWSMLAHNTTLPAPPRAAPRPPRLHPTPRGGVEVNWGAAQQQHAHEVTEYVVSWSPMGGASASGGGAIRVSAPQTTVRLDNLLPTTTYRFMVQARNSAGLGPLSTPVLYTTGEVVAGDTDAGGWMSSWLWASAGGALGALALGAALAVSYCRRQHHTATDDNTTYQKSAATAALKPPDLWIHHDQMELKHLDKHNSLHKMSTSSIDACGGGVMNSAPGTMIPASIPREPRPATLDRRHYVPTYVDDWSVGSTSDVTSPARSSTANDSYNTTHYSYLSMGGAGCAATCDRRLRSMAHDQSGTIMSTNSGQASLPRPGNTCSGPGCTMTATCPLSLSLAGDVYACARERGHYVAYEPIHLHTNTNANSTREQESSSLSECGRSACNSSLGAPIPIPNTGVNLTHSGVNLTHSGVNLTHSGVPLTNAGYAVSLPPSVGTHSGGVSLAHSGPLHSFTRTDTGSSERSTPSHSRGSVRETSPYKQSASSSPSHNVRQHIPSDALHQSELEPLTPSRSSERLQREMDNLEGLMRDLTDITRHHHYHC